MAWTDYSECGRLTPEGERIHDAELWFPVKLGAEYAEPALRVCGTCPVIRECYEYAVSHELHGIWGGATERDRYGVPLVAVRHG